MCLVFALKINELTYRILFNARTYNTEQQKLKQNNQLYGKIKH